MNNSFRGRLPEQCWALSPWLAHPLQRSLSRSPVTRKEPGQGMWEVLPNPAPCAPQCGHLGEPGEPVHPITASQSPPHSARESSASPPSMHGVGSNAAEPWWDVSGDTSMLQAPGCMGQTAGWLCVPGSAVLYVILQKGLQRSKGPFAVALGVPQLTLPLGAVGLLGRVEEQQEQGLGPSRVGRDRAGTCRLHCPWLPQAAAMGAVLLVGWECVVQGVLGEMLCHCTQQQQHCCPPRPSQNSWMQLQLHIRPQLEHIP